MKKNGYLTIITMESIKQRKSPNEIEEWLIDALSESVGINPDEIETNLSFESYGLDSSTAVILSGDLQEWLECNLDPTIFFDYPTIAEMVNYLTAK